MFLQRATIVAVAPFLLVILPHQVRANLIYSFVDRPAIQGSGPATYNVTGSISVVDAAPDDSILSLAEVDSFNLTVSHGAVTDFTLTNSNSLLSLIGVVSLSSSHIFLPLPAADAENAFSIERSPGAVITWSVDRFVPLSTFQLYGAQFLPAPTPLWFTTFNSPPQDLITPFDIAVRQPTSAVPEPSTLVMSLVPICGCAAFWIRRRVTRALIRPPAAAFIGCVVVLSLAGMARAGVVSYARDTDFGTLTFTGPGDVTADLELVPGAGNPVDFSSFTAGHIAVIERGTIPFSYKIYDAQVYGGAVGAIILNQPGDSGSLGGSFGGFPENPPAVTQLIPGVRLSTDLSAALRAELLAGPISPIRFRIDVDVTHDSNDVLVDRSQLQRFVSDGTAVPEPSTFVMSLIPICGCAASWIHRRVKRAMPPYSAAVGHCRWTRNVLNFTRQKGM
jgi:hypothetical protein